MTITREEFKNASCSNQDAMQVIDLMADIARDGAGLKEVQAVTAFVKDGAERAVFAVEILSRDVSLSHHHGDTSKIIPKLLEFDGRNERALPQVCNALVELLETLDPEMVPQCVDNASLQRMLQVAPTRTIRFMESLPEEISGQMMENFIEDLKDEGAYATLLSEILQSQYTARDSASLVRLFASGYDNMAKQEDFRKRALASLLLPHSEERAPTNA